jgi:hypothetical protein
MSTTPTSTTGSASSAPRRPLSEDEPGQEGDDHDLGVAEHRRQPRSHQPDGVMPDHQVQRQEDPGQHRQPYLRGGARPVGSSLEVGDQAQCWQGVRTPEDGGGRRFDVRQPHEDAGEGDRHRSEHRGHHRAIGEGAED